MARVIALETGHDGVQLRHEGEQFDVPDERVNKDGNPSDGSTWFTVVAKAPPAKKPGGRPPGAGPLKGSRTTETD